MRTLIKISLCVAFFVSCFSTYGQISRYHLGNGIYQNNDINPAYFPEGRIFIGLPVLSQMQAGFNTRFTYSDIFTKQEDGSTLLQFDNLLGSLKKNNLLQLHMKFADVHVGYRKNQAAISFFSNERIEFDFQYPKRLINLGLNGNLQFVGRTIDIKGMGVKARYFRETGVGFTFFEKSGRFSAGTRVKLYNGFFNATTKRGLDATLNTSEDNYELSVSLENGVLNTAGFNVPDGSSFPIPHLLVNKNRGLGLDLGVDYKVHKYLTVAASINDIGYISWKEDPENYTVRDTAFTYAGVDIKNNSSIVQALEDSLFNRFRRVTTNDAYIEWNPITMNASASWNLTDRDIITGTISSRFLFGKTHMTYAAGITHRFGRIWTLNANLVRLPQQFFNVGVSTVVDAGPVQFYLATDKTIGYDLTNVKNANISTGINLIFGRGIKKEKSYTPSNFRFLGGDNKKVKGKEKIYLFIKKQKKSGPIRSTDTKQEKKLRKIKLRDLFN